MSDGKRQVNLDPGILSEERLILATGKNYTHRIYLRNGIYGDLTLIYGKGSYRTLPWTYPDYSDPRLIHFLCVSAAEARFSEDRQTPPQIFPQRRQPLISSMTAFGRTRKEESGYLMTVEIRTLNSRFLDVVLRMPKNFLEFEDPCRKRIAADIKRGRVEVFVQMESTNPALKAPPISMILARHYWEQMRGPATGTSRRATRRSCRTFFRFRTSMNRGKR